MTVEEIINAYPTSWITYTLIITTICPILWWLVILVTKLVDLSKPVFNSEEKRSSWYSYAVKGAVVTTIFFAFLTSMSVYANYLTMEDRLEHWGNEYLQQYIYEAKVTKQEVSESDTIITRNAKTKGVADLTPKSDTANTSIMYVGYREDESVSKPYLEIRDYDKKLIDFIKQKGLDIEVYLPSQYYLILPEGYFDETTE